MFSTVTAMVGNGTAGGCGAECAVGAVLLGCDMTWAAGALVGGLLGDGEGDGVAIALGLVEGAGLAESTAPERVTATARVAVPPFPPQPDIATNDAAATAAQPDLRNALLITFSPQ